MKVDGSDLSGEVVIHRDDGALVKPFIAPQFIPTEGYTAKESKYPHHTLEVYDEKGEFFRSIPIALIAGFFKGDFHNFLDLEVIYVGQAYGSEGNRHAITRLNSHSTLQKILADIASDQPNYEVLLLLYPFEYHRLIYNMDGRAKPTIDGDADKKHAAQVFEAKFKRNMRISIAEAALIRHFEPKYNDIFKSNFPSNKHKILKKAYDLDFAALVVEINTEDLWVRHYSHSKPNMEHHICKFDLHSPEERKSFFFSHI